MDKWFHSQSKLIQVILLIIPFVNWVVEVLVRWSAVLSKKKSGVLSIVIAVLVTFVGLAFAWVDAIYCLITNRLILE